MPDPPAQLVVGNIGCGTGAATLLLGRLLPRAQITADFLPLFLERLQRRCDAEGVADRVGPMEALMDMLPFADDHFYRLFSEGAVYRKGFEHGVRARRGLFKPDG